MTRTLDDPDDDDILEWQERVTDVDGHFPSIALELDAIDDGGGWTQQDIDSSNVSWLGFSTTENTLGDGTAEVLVDITADSTQLSTGYKYRFEIFADDGFVTSARTFTLEVVSSALYLGDRIYALSDQDDLVDSYNLSTAWDLTTASTTVNTLDVSSQSNTPDCMWMRPNGEELYVADANSDRIWKYTLSTAFDLSTASYSGTSFSDGATQWTGLYFKPDGTKIFGIYSGEYDIVAFDLSTTWDITTASNTNNIIELYENPDVGSPSGVYVKNDGTKVFVSRFNQNIHSYELSTAWDLSTSSYLSEYTSSELGIPNDIYFRPNGEEMFIPDAGTVYKYTLSTAWDITTATFQHSAQFSTNDISGVAFGG